MEKERTRKRTLLPPSPEDKRIAHEVEQRVGGGGNVTFYGIDKGDNNLGYGLILEYMTARKVIERDYPFLDVLEIAQLYERWRETMRYAEKERRWTTVPQ